MVSTNWWFGVVCFITSFDLIFLKPNHLLCENIFVTLERYCSLVTLDTSEHTIEVEECNISHAVLYLVVERTFMTNLLHIMLYGRVSVSVGHIRLVERVTK